MPAPDWDAFADPRTEQRFAELVAALREAEASLLRVRKVHYGYLERSRNNCGCILCCIDSSIATINKALGDEK